MPLKTPDWILKGEKPPKEKKKGKTFKIRKCPKCESMGVEVVLGQEEGRGSSGWECKKCKWKGRDVVVEVVGEEEFMKNLEEK